MKVGRLAAIGLAAIALGGQPEPAFRIECACPITVRGNSPTGLTYKSSGRVRVFAKAGVKWIVADSPAAELLVNLPVTSANVVVRSQGGDIDIRNVKGSAQVETVGGRVFLDAIDGDASARTGGGGIKIGRIGGSLRALSGGDGISVGQVGGESWCETVGGEIIVDRAGGVLHLTTGGGNIYVSDAAASVIARSDGGLIDVQRAGGVVEAETRGGSIQVGAAKGARCESSAGAIRVRNISGYLRAQTGMGSILADILAGARLDDSSLTTGAGDITVMLPSNLAVSVQAVSESRGRLARIISDFPEIRIIGSNLWPLRTIAAEGVLNGGGPRLYVTAAGGTVFLRRQR